MRPLARLRRARRSSTEQGSGTILVLAMMGVLLSLSAVMFGVGQFVVARHRTASAADLAALAGAAASPDQDRCQLAGQVAADNGARIVACRIETVGASTRAVVSVTVQVEVQVLGRQMPVRSQARAGPA